MNKIRKEDIDIPIEDNKIILKSSIYFSSNTPKKAPFIINIVGLGETKESYFVRNFSDKFADSGYYVLSYNHRKGNLFKNFISLFTDISKVISWLIQNQKNRLLEDSIILFGRSLGGTIILTQGFIDKRAKILISLCARFDYHTYLDLKFPEDIILKTSPKYFLKKNPKNNQRILLAHCHDDNRIPFENVVNIKESLGLNDENVIKYNTGGHSFKDNRDNLFEHVIKFLKKL